MFDNFNVNLRKNEGFPTSVPCIPIPEYCQSNATLILGLISRRPTSAKLYSRIINLMRQRNKVFSMEIEILIRFIFVNNLQLCYSKKSIYELLHIRHVSFHWTMMSNCHNTSRSHHCHTMHEKETFAEWWVRTILFWLLLTKIFRSPLKRHVRYSLWLKFESFRT